MASDVSIVELLEAEGFSGPAADRARAILEEAGLTRPGKTRIASAKRAGAREILAARLTRRCGHRSCTASANGREIVLVPKTGCEVCGGSSNRRAGQQAGAALRAAGIRRLLVLGGTPTTHRALRAVLEPAGLELRCVDGTEGVRPAWTVAADLAWADVMVVWASTPLPHKVSQAYIEQAPRGLRKITVARRGVEAVRQELARLVG